MEKSEIREVEHPLSKERYIQLISHYSFPHLNVKHLEKSPLAQSHSETMCFRFLRLSFKEAESKQFRNSVSKRVMVKCAMD